MHIKQVRTKNNAFSTVRYDSAGNILTPARKKELKPKKTNKKTKGPKWIKIISQYSGLCCVCNNGILVREEMLWYKKNKKTKHLECSK